MNEFENTILYFKPNDNITVYYSVIGLENDILTVSQVKYKDMPGTQLIEINEFKQANNCIGLTYKND